MKKYPFSIRRRDATKLVPDEDVVLKGNAHVKVVESAEYTKKAEDTQHKVDEQELASFADAASPDPKYWLTLRKAKINLALRLIQASSEIPGVTYIDRTVENRVFGEPSFCVVTENGRRFEVQVRETTQEFRAELAEGDAG